MRRLSARLVCSSLSVLLLAFGLVSAGPAAADYVTPYSLSVSIGGNTYGLGDLDWTYTPSSAGDGGEYTLDTPAVTPFGTVSDWGSIYDVDPQVTNNFTVVNTTAFTQTFIVSVTSPISPAIGPGSLMRGSIGITLTDEGPLDAFGDTDGSALLQSTASTPTYQAYIDGSPVWSLLNAGPVSDPYTLYTLTCGLYNCTTTGSENFGIPTRIVGPSASSTIGITVKFELSPGDSAAVTSVFNIIPEPTTAALLGLGLLGLAVTRRAGRRTQP